jgi:hypothetical protein
MNDTEIKKLTYDEIIELRNQYHQKAINLALESIAEQVATKIRHFIYSTDSWDPFIKVGQKPLPLTMVEEYLSTKFTIQLRVYYQGAVNSNVLVVLLCEGGARP